MRLFTPFLALVAAASGLSTVEKTVTKGAVTVPPAGPSINRLSALQALESVLPTSLRDLAITRPAAAESVIVSEFADGHTPAWFTKLPSAVQSYLRPVTTIVQAPSIVLSAVAAESTVLQNATVVPLTSSAPYKNMTMTRSNKTMSSTRHSSHSSKATSKKPSSTTQHHSTSSSTGGAAIPTAIVGGALAGLFGLLGMIAL